MWRSKGAASDDVVWEVCGPTEENGKCELKPSSRRNPITGLHLTRVRTSCTENLGLISIHVRCGRKKMGWLCRGKGNVYFATLLIPTFQRSWPNDTSRILPFISYRRERVRNGFTRRYCHLRKRLDFCGEDLSLAGPRPAPLSIPSWPYLKNKVKR